MRLGRSAKISMRLRDDTTYKMTRDKAGRDVIKAVKEAKKNENNENNTKDDENESSDDSENESVTNVVRSNKAALVSTRENRNHCEDGRDVLDKLMRLDGDTFIALEEKEQTKIITNVNAIISETPNMAVLVKELRVDYNNLATEKTDIMASLVEAEEERDGAFNDVQTLENMLSATKGLLAELHNFREGRASTTGTPVISSRKVANIPDTDSFNGNRSTYKVWEEEVEDTLELDAELFDGEERIVGYIKGLLDKKVRNDVFNASNSRIETITELWELLDANYTYYKERTTAR
ncbi:hypothetical protein BJ878DRAFT_573925 [Calycina marina]|uniref:Uncharacterized protein n=1 Tax=Calycina marina TaxID=1763456 RepID=A0A9P8CGS9_9HELO|nr:hypothetical protein BJ878DRAFT_573925 [Calycina marina]